MQAAKLIIKTVRSDKSVLRMNLSSGEMAILSEEKEHEAKILFINQRLSAEHVSTAPSRGLPHTPSFAGGR